MVDDPAVPLLPEVSDTEIGAESDRASAEKDYRTLSNGELSPRQRRLAFLAAQGNSNQTIARELGYSDSRVSILLKEPHIVVEIQKFQERIYEDTIGLRMRGFADPALNVIQHALLDRTGKIKPREKIEVAQWVIEKLDGKAVQKLEAGTGLLAQLMERLDARKTAVTQVNITQNFAPASHLAIEGSERPVIETPLKDEEDLLKDWFTDFDESRET